MAYSLLGILRSPCSTLILRVGIMVEGKILGFELPIIILNIHVHHNHKQVFWEKLQDPDLFDHCGLILGGDLNLTLVDSEIWGAIRLNDTLHGFFNFWSIVQLGLMGV